MRISEEQLRLVDLRWGHSTAAQQRAASDAFARSFGVVPGNTGF